MDDEFTACEALAKAFHEAYEELAPTYDYETRPESQRSWEDVPLKNRRLMTATVALVAAESPDLFNAVVNGLVDVS